MPKKYQRGGKADTVPAMLTPGEVVLNEKQQKALEKYIGQSREEIFGKIKVPGFNKGGKVKYKKYYQKGGEVKKKAPEKKAMSKLTKMYKDQKGREFRKTLAGNAPDLDDDLWTKYISGGSDVLKGLLSEQTKRDSAKVKKGYKKGGKVKNAYERMYKAKWGG
jgi:hypothetical protein